MLIQWKIALIAWTVAILPLAAQGRKCVDLFSETGRAGLDQPVSNSIYQRYLQDTIDGLERMRSPRSGILYDKIEVEALANGDERLWVINESTSPTNIALDLVLLADGRGQNDARAKILRILQHLAIMPFHEESGLFFSWYLAAQPETVTGYDISSIDNLHLAQALWVLGHRFVGTQIGALATQIFERMDFSLFYDSTQDKIGGELTFKDGKWKLASYRYDQLGSESRQLLTLGWALRLFKKISDEDFLKAVDNLAFEWFYPPPGALFGPILKTWEGGAFQLLLPELWIGEHLYSPQLRESFKNYARATTVEARRRGLPLPAAHSAANYTTEIDRRFGNIVPSYVGKAGSLFLVNSGNRAVDEPRYRNFWEAVVTPHAVFLAAYANPSLIFPYLESAEKLRSGPHPIYRRGLGWMDGFWVQPPFAGEVVNVQLSLNQGMIALVLQSMMDPSYLSISAETYYRNPEVRARLAEVYQRIDQRIGAGL